MRIGFLLAAAVVGFSMLVGQGAAAADIHILSVTPFKTTLDELGPQFERTTGHKLTIRYDVSAALKRRIEAGEPFDLALILAPIIDDLLRQGKVAAGTRTDIARGAIGVAIKKGATKPDISSVEAFKRTLLEARSIAYSADGATGVYFKGVLERLGIVIETRSKLRPMEGATVVQPVARGEAEIAVASVPIVLREPGAELVGRLPTELQHYLVYTGGVGAVAQDAEAAKALLKFLMAPAAVSVMNSKGLEAVAP
jgi:molybdate transport system substrate-binding protein